MSRLAAAFAWDVRGMAVQSQLKHSDTRSPRTPVPLEIVLLGTATSAE
jgi:hypothetical protein